MIQDAINQLSQLIAQFKLAYSIEVLPDGCINLFVLENEDSDQTELHEFRNATKLLEWMEENLTKYNDN